MAKVTDLNYALENRLIKRLDKFADMVQRKKQIQDVLFCVNGLTGCLSGDTILYGQTKSLGELYNSGTNFVNTISKTKRGYFVKSKSEIIPSGKKEVYEIELENGEKVLATAEHKFFKQDKNNIREEEVSNLKVGDNLVCYLPIDIEIYITIPKCQTAVYFRDIKSIRKIGVVETYDLNTPTYENFFLNNGILSHNSGKTNSALVMAYYLKWVTGRDIHLFFSTDKAASFLKETKEKIIVIDEPSLDSLSKDQATRTSKNFSRLMNTMRQKRHIVIVCVTRFWRFPIDLIVDRSLAMINMSNKGGRGIGRFQYIRQNKLEMLWDNYQKYRKKDFAKLKSFGGSMPERMEKINPSTSKPFFNSMGVIINNKPNCTYKDYKFFRDNEVKDIGVEKKSLKDLKVEKELAKVRYVFAKVVEEYKLPVQEIADRLEISRRRLPEWREFGGMSDKSPLSVSNP